MNGWIGITDNEWFTFLSRQPEIDEVNFWQPGGKTLFRALKPGEPFLFKLHAPLSVAQAGARPPPSLQLQRMQGMRSDQTSR